MSEWNKINWEDIMIKEPTGKARETSDGAPRMAILDIPGKPRVALFWRPRKRSDTLPWLDGHSGNRYSQDQVHEKPRGWKP